jgi:hypothetical protein
MEIQNQLEMNRRKFLGAAATALFAGVTIQILGCDNNDYGSNTNPDANPNSNPNGTGNNTTNQNATATTNATAAAPATADRTGSVGTNHPPPGDHIAIVTGAQQDAGLGITLSIMGNAAHDHTITLTAADMANIKNGVMVSKTSTTTLSHNHVVTFATVTSIVRR